MLSSNDFEQMISTMKSHYSKAWTTVLAYIENEVTGPETSTCTHKHPVNTQV